MFSKGQGTIEYLLIISVVIVIALVLVSLLTGFLSAGDGVDETHSKIYWSSQPIALLDGIIRSDGDGTLVIQNNESETVTVTSIVIDGETYNLESGSGKSLSLGQKYSFDINGAEPCTMNKQSYTVSINYTTKNGINKKVASEEFVVTCGTALIPDAVTFANFDPTTGAFLISTGGSDNTDFIASGTDVNGIILPIDKNTMCFGGTGCDANIQWDGTNLIIGTR